MAPPYPCTKRAWLCSLGRYRGNRQRDIYVQTQLAPTLSPQDVVICDNLNVHKSPCAAQAITKRGAWILFLPKYSPDLKAIEMAFAKLKVHLRKANDHSYEALWTALGHICNLYTPAECGNYLKQTGYVAK